MIHDTDSIKVGQIYTHPEMMGHRFLGVGMRKLFTSDEFVKKHLIILESPDGKGKGMIMQEGENAQESVWGMGFAEEGSDESGFYII